MAKFSNPSKLSDETQQELLVQLCRVIAELKNPFEAAQFLKDILSAQEVEMIAKRLKIAERLLAGDTYSEIAFAYKIGTSTISRVHEWLKISGDGFRLAINKIEKEPKFPEPPITDLRALKKRYPIYYWPQLVLENVVRSAKGREKKRLMAVLNQMDKKSALYKQLRKATR